MSQFGQALRNERVSRGITLETISSSTKVVTRYLAALEDEHFEVLPGGILSKGIVRSYARTVGIDETAWVERFLAASGECGIAPKEDDWVHFASKVAETRVRTGSRSHTGFRWAAIALLLGLLLGLGFFFWHRVNESVEAQELQSHSVTAVAAPGPVADGSQ